MPPCIKYVLPHLDCALPQTDYYGGDLWRERAETLKECGKRCLKVPGCKKWTFRNDEMTGRCYMKNISDNLMTTKLSALTGSRDSGVKKCGNNGKIQIIKTVIKLTYLNFNLTL